MHGLCLRQETDGLHDVGRGEGDFRAGDTRYRPHRLLDRFDAAEPAADGSGKATAPGLETRVGTIHQADLDVDALARLFDLDRLDLAG